MSVRQSQSQRRPGETANDNEPCRAIAAEGVVQCLQFLANEAEYLGYAAANDILRAAFAMQGEINADRGLGVLPPKLANPSDRLTPAILAPTA